MSVRLGINPLTWSNDDMPELGGATPLETCLSEARLAGYAGVELGNKFPREPRVLGLTLGRHALDLVSGWYSGRLLERPVVDEIEAMNSHRMLLSALDCKVMVFAEVSRCIHGDRATALSGRPVLADREWREFGARLTEVAKYLHRRGLRMAYHHHMGTVVQSEAEIDRLMAETGPEVGLLLDTGHLTYAGGDPVAVAQRHAGRIVHVHCKDVRRPVLDEALADDRSFLDAVVDGVFTVPGDGCVDYDAVLGTLGAGYAGWLVVEAEQDPEKAHPLTYARMGFANLSGFARRAGLQIY